MFVAELPAALEPAPADEAEVPGLALEELWMGPPDEPPTEPPYDPSTDPAEPPDPLPDDRDEPDDFPEPAEELD